MESSEKDNIHVFRISRETPARETTAMVTVSKSRTSLSGGTKRLICEDHIQNPRSTQEELATKYGCKRTTIAKIIKGKDRWLSIDSDVKAKRFRQRTSRYPVIENALQVWIQKEQQESKVITDQMLQAQARLYAQTFDNVGQDFKASSSWLTKFKKRCMNNSNSDFREESTPLFVMDSNSENDTSSPPPPSTTTLTIVPSTSPNITPTLTAIPSTCSNNTPTTTPLNTTDTNSTSRTDIIYPSKTQQSIVFPAREKTPDKNISEWRYPDNSVNDTRNRDELTRSSTPIPEGGELFQDDGGGDRGISPFDESEEEETSISQSQARQHLEAVLSYYTNQKQESSMSAELIRLVLKKDF